MYFNHMSIFFELKMFFKKKYLFLYFSLISLLFSGCTPINQVKGYLPNDLKKEMSQSKMLSKTDVLINIGEPVIKNYDDSEWIFFKQNVEKFAFFKPKVKERNIFVFQFDLNDNLIKINEYDLTDEKTVKIDKDFIKTEGKKISFFDQMLGNLGNFSPEQFFD